MSKYILITGGELFNKGAEAMSLATISEMKEKFPDKEVILLSSRDYERPESEKEDYKFGILPFTNDIIYGLLGGIGRTAWKSLRLVRKPTINTHLDLMPRFEEIIRNTHAIVDISGYEFSSQWGIRGVHYIARIALAEKFNIPIYIMPQSLGPFNYGGIKQKFMDSMIDKYMIYPKVIYAREQEGYNILSQEYGLDNVELSLDLVLLNEETNLTNVLKYNSKPLNIKVENGVGITPNMRNFDHGQRDTIINTYKQIIDSLLNENMNVYLMRHAEEDLEACELIKDMFKEDERVVLISRELKSYEFNELVSQYNFLIGSRYHSIVHAYKNNIPCIAIGWATKYRELLDAFNQGEYIFDVRKNLDTASILEAVDKLSNNYQKESEIISEKINQIQEKNIFDIVK